MTNGAYAYCFLVSEKDREAFLTWMNEEWSSVRKGKAKAEWPIIHLEKGEWPIHGKLIPGSPIAEKGLHYRGANPEKSSA